MKIDVMLNRINNNFNKEIKSNKIKIKLKF